MRTSALAILTAAPMLVAAAPPANEATEATKAAHAEVADRLNLDDTADRDAATRGFLARIEEDAILNPNGSVAWDVRQFDFLQGPAPATVNPSLWRQSALGAIHGLFRIADGVYQVRGYDLANMTLIEGASGWIVVDPLTTAAPASAALKLANDTLGARPVSAVIYTHSHGDHFGGVTGVLPDDSVARAGIPIVAPAGFVEAAVGENILAGTAMNRRVQYQFGTDLPRAPAANVGSGIAQALSRGDVSLVPPTIVLSPEGETRAVDGVTFEFVDASDTEAPSGMVFYMPEKRVLLVGDVVLRGFHNLLTPRGAIVRDGLKWSKLLDDMLVRFAGRADVMLPSHQWPTWGSDNVAQSLRNQRDAYRYVHDQTLRLANQGLTPVEIAEAIGEPDFAATDFGVRDYYGTMNHNAKAVYQRYLGWWDGVPATYHELPPVEASWKYVTAMGGAEAALKVGTQAFEGGDYRWAATVFNHLVFADPQYVPAREWLAATYEQLGFQAEAGTWRNIYLTGARELREGRRGPEGVETVNPRILTSIPAVDLFDALAARFNPAKKDATESVLLFRFPDRREMVRIDLRSSVMAPRALDYDAEKAANGADLIATIDRGKFTQLLLQRTTPAELVASGDLAFDGNPALLAALFGALDPVDPNFAISTP